MSTYSTQAYETLKKKWIAGGQEQVFTWEHLLSDEDKKRLFEQLEAINLDDVNARYEICKNPSQVNGSAGTVVVEPITTFKLKDCSDEEKQRWTDIAYQAIRKGEVAILLMAGGQGTRLGSDDPKGTFDMKLLSGKTLFQLHAERIVRLQELIQQQDGGKAVQIPWYIMLSDPVHAKTVDFFKKHNYFGLNPDQIIFFDQSDFPCLTPDGKVIMESAKKVSAAPNGNGGLWLALKEQGHLDKMRKNGIRWIASYIIDNILAKVCDPLLLGFGIEKDLDIASKVTAKINAAERVGVLALRNGRNTVLEYTEISDEKREEVSADGELVYNASHLVINNFKLDFIDSFSDNLVTSLPPHKAEKVIPWAQGDNGATVKPDKPNGWKIELFAFDVYEHAKKMYALQIERSEEFSPLKNSLAAPTDNAETCRRHLSNLHKKWIIAAGGKIEGDEDALCEISPLISYAGEGLEEHVKDKTIKLPFHLKK